MGGYEAGREYRECQTLLVSYLLSGEQFDKIPIVSGGHSRYDQKMHDTKRLKGLLMMNNQWTGAGEEDYVWYF